MHGMMLKPVPIVKSLTATIGIGWQKPSSDRQHRRLGVFYAVPLVRYLERIITPCSGRPAIFCSFSEGRGSGRGG